MFRQVVVAVALVVATVVPAQALTVNDLFFEQSLLGSGGGGNLSDAQIASLIAANEAALGEDISVIGKVEVGAGGSTSFDPEAGFASDDLLSFTCNTAGAEADCKTGFTATFDLSGEWQVVKVAVKGGGPTVPNGIFFICDGPCTGTELQQPPLDPIQGLSISSTEWAAFCATASGGSCPSNFPGVSNFLVFATQATQPSNGVPEPATLILLGAGLLGTTLVSRRRRR